MTRLAMLSLGLVLLVGCRSPRSHCERYTDRIAQCHDLSTVSTTLIPHGWGPPWIDQLCRERYRAVEHMTDKVDCVLAAAEGDCAEVYACVHWVAARYGSFEERRGQAPPVHFRGER